MDNMNDTGELFKYNLKSIEKIDKTHLKVECESDLFVDLDDEWHVSQKLLLKIFADKYV